MLSLEIFLAARYVWRIAATWKRYIKQCFNTFIHISFLCLKTIANVDAAMKSAGRQKRDVSDTMMVGQLKKKAANLMTNVKDKQG